MDLKLVETKDFNALRKDLREIKKTNKELQELWLTTEEAGDLLKVKGKTLKRYRDKGELPCSRIGRRVMYKKSDLVKFFKSRYFSGDKL